MKMSVTFGEAHFLFDFQEIIYRMMNGIKKKKKEELL